MRRASREGLSTWLRSKVGAVLLSIAAPGVTGISLFDSSWVDLNRLPFIPVPEIATDPNSGTTYGLLPVYLATDANGDVRHILAPDINYNSTLGVGGDFRLFNYPSEDREWYFVAGASEVIAREVDLDFATGLTRRGCCTFEGRVYFERDPTQRFFGLGNDSDFADESNYTAEHFFTDSLFAVNLSPELQATLEERPEYFRIRHGAFTNVPFTGNEFPALAGLDGGTEFLHRLILSHDTRDSSALPTRGGLLALFGGFADRRLGSSFSYGTFALEARRYVPFGTRFVLAAHFHLQYMTSGASTPFWALSRLGGETGVDQSALGLPLGTAQTWRGGGAGRFVDRNLVAANIELRTRVFELGVSGAHVIVELAPFVDLGRVFSQLGTNPFDIDDLHPAGGIGFRAVVRPFVVGYVDVGYGADGSAVFSGINYPF
jgi:Omp85 superfamily domain